MEQDFLEVSMRTKGPNSMLTDLRKEGFIPGVLYGSNVNNLPIQVNRKELLKQLKSHGKSGIFAISLENEQVTVKINELQRNAIDGEVVHVDLQQIDLDKIVAMKVPIHLFGQAVGVKNGGTVQLQLRDVVVKALPSFIPESIHLNVSDLNFGEAIYIRDLMVPNEVEVLEDPNSVVLTILPPKMSEEITDEGVPKKEPEVVDAKDGRGIDAAK